MVEKEFSIDTQRRTCLLIWIRHGERADEVHPSRALETHIQFTNDPPITS